MSFYLQSPSIDKNELYQSLKINLMMRILKSFERDTLLQTL